MLIATILAIAFGIFWFAYYKDIYLEGKKSPDKLKTEGWELHDAGEIEKAAEKFRKAIEKDSKFAAALFGLGSCYNQQGNYDKAKDYFLKTLEIKKDYYTARISYARCIVRLTENKAEAIRIAEREIAQVPQTVYADMNVAYNFAAYYAVTGDNGKALDWLRYAISKNSSMKARAKKDKDFEKLRDSKMFQNLVD